MTVKDMGSRARMSARPATALAGRKPTAAPNALAGARCTPAATTTPSPNDAGEPVAAEPSGRGETSSSPLPHPAA